jgi:hypothetical protein
MRIITETFKAMDKNLLMIDRQYVTMETLKAGNYLAVRKEDYDRIVFLTEVYGNALLIPEGSTVNVIPIVERQNKVFEVSSTGAYLIPMRDLKLTVDFRSSHP